MTAYVGGFRAVGRAFLFLRALHLLTGTLTLCTHAYQHTHNHTHSPDAYSQLGGCNCTIVRFRTQQSSRFDRSFIFLIFGVLFGSLFWVGRKQSNWMVGVGAARTCRSLRSSISTDLQVAMHEIPP